MTFGQVLLVAVLVLPALGAVAVAATPRDRAARVVGTIAAALTLLAAVPLVLGDRNWFAWSTEAPAVRPGTRWTCRGCPAWRCASTSAWTASPGRWWC
ncbi:hypothetical protein GCM10027614_57000 [Micromonospora vulcania]